MSVANSTVSLNSTVHDKPVQRRSKGERTREKILLAAINVLAINGIKGTTHRAIANYADLQLSLTTYYFKDIGELIQQAFEYNSEYLRAKTDTILDQAFTTLANIDAASLQEISVKREICNKLAEMTAKHIFENIKKESVALTVEQLMFTTIPVSPELKKLAQAHKQSQVEPFTKLASYFNSINPEIDANMMQTVFSQLEYSQLPLEPEEVSIEPIQQIAKKLIGWVMGITSNDNA